MWLFLQTHYKSLFKHHINIIQQFKRYLIIIFRWKKKEKLLLLTINLDPPPKKKKKANADKHDKFSYMIPNSKEKKAKLKMP